MKRKLGKKIALATAFAVLMSQTAFAISDSATYNDYTFSYGLSGSASSVYAYCIYSKTDDSVNVSTNITAYEFKTSSPLTVKTVSASASRTANNSAPAQASGTADSGYEFYRANGTYKVSDREGSLTKTLSISI